MRPLLNRMSDHNRTLHLLLFCIGSALLSLWIIDLNWPAHLVYYGDDMKFHVNRILGIKTALENGDFPFYLNNFMLNGYGYGENLFYCNFTLLPAGFMAYLGMDMVSVYKLYIFMITLFTAIITYACVKQLNVSFIGATVISVLYTFSAYRLYDIFDRAALGEAVAFMFIPIVFLGVYYIFNGKNWIFLSIGMSGIILTHMLSTLMIVSAIILICLAHLKKIINQPKIVFHFIYAILLTSAVTMFFVFPMLEQLVSNDFYLDREQFVTLEFLKSYALGFRQIWNGIFMQKNSVLFGFIPFVLIALRFFIKRNKLVRIGDLSLFLGLLYMFMATRYFPFDYVPFLKMFQFPWRFFEMATFFITLSGGLFLEVFFHQQTVSTPRRLGAVLLILLVAFASLYVSFQNYKPTAQHRTQLNSSNFQLNQKNMKFNPNAIGTKEYLPTRTDDRLLQNLFNQSVTIEQSNNQFKVINYEKSGNTIKATVKKTGNSHSGDVLNMPALYYKGYYATLNGREVQVRQSSNGLVTVEINESGLLILDYMGTPVQKVSMFISILTVVLLVAGILIKQYRRYHTERAKWIESSCSH